MTHHVTLRRLGSQLLKGLEQGRPPAHDAGFLGINPSYDQASLVIVPVPWEATTSYGQGTAGAPEGIRVASHQLDVAGSAFGDPYARGILLEPLDEQVLEWNKKACLLTKTPHASLQVSQVNDLSEKVHGWLRDKSRLLIQQGHLVACLGGDHSSPLGLIQALGEVYPVFSILHIDAHHDLRSAYQGYEYSHASIMDNVLRRVPSVSKLVQMGIRDFSKEEKHKAMVDPRILAFYDADLGKRLIYGESFGDICREIVQPLSEHVYVSFDIDGLDPSLCPATGTPVPGGLQYQQACFLLEALVHAKKNIIGFDLCEVSSGVPHRGSTWDMDVGARILYQLSGASLASLGEAHKKGDPL